MLKFTLFFQFVAVIFRVFFLLYAGKVGSPIGHFILFRSVDAGQSILAFIALTLYIYQLKEKFRNHDEADFDYWALKRTLLCRFWMYFVLFGLYWGTFFFMSMDKKNLTYIDFATSAVFPIMMLILLAQVVGLIKQIPNSFYQYESVGRNVSLKKAYDWTKAPGIY